MIYKQRSIPKKLIGLSALMPRLQPSHIEMQRVREEFRIRKAGYGGEQHFDKHLLEFKPLYPHAILHDVCLKQNGVYFQMDSVLITPAFILIIEVKNIAGKIIVKSNPTQFIQESLTGERKVLSNPIAELERKQLFLIEWLKQRKIDIPISGLVAFAFTNELIVENVPETKITFTNEAPTYLYSLSVDKEIISKDIIRKLAFELRNNHQEYDPFPITKLMNISPIDILPGVICPACKTRGMQWKHKKWVCQMCDHTGQRCHVDALADWICLIGNRITNKEFRSFMLLNDRQVTTRFLARSGLSHEGKGKGSFYTMNEKTNKHESALHEL
ncbi:nuclease-related domain-containing protein [Sporosarcina sp. E16_8]|uniref:nuclease-related domain-containing protein n=1 Tax=Sporosarcina sp. E16_8 TaxID=2789295 RepID=UPI001A91036B|nr:nuclease-related domain-containing protein [Sporosarcina sp. E16_8]MBO0589699.1 NERD domain-containing protein [Sporosarcina sp. E16_8]